MVWLHNDHVEAELQYMDGKPSIAHKPDNDNCGLQHVSASQKQGQMAFETDSSNGIFSL